jgi:hypothetical protein
VPGEDTGKKRAQHVLIYGDEMSSSATQRGSSVVAAMCYRLDGRGSITGRDRYMQDCVYETPRAIKLAMFAENYSAPLITFTSRTKTVIEFLRAVIPFNDTLPTVMSSRKDLFIYLNQPFRVRN